MGDDVFEVRRLGLWASWIGGWLYDQILFFFQAEDGIRDWSVTGVQTCALPILLGHTVMGQSTILSGNIPYHFNVRLRPAVDYPLDETLLRSIIEQEKPAFCSYTLSIEPQ